MSLALTLIGCEAGPLAAPREVPPPTPLENRGDLLADAPGPAVWSPDGRELLYLPQNLPPGGGPYMAVDVATHVSRTLSQSPRAYTGSVAISSDGVWVYSSEEALGTKGIYRGAAVGGTFTVIWSPRSASPSRWTFAVSPDGSTLAIAHDSLYLETIATQGVRSLGLARGAMVAFSPNGNEVAQLSGGGQVLITNVMTGTDAVVADGVSTDGLGGVRWIADTVQILYASGPNLLMRTVTPGQVSERVVFTTNESIMSAGWSRDRREAAIWVLGACLVSGESACLQRQYLFYKLDVATGNAANIGAAAPTGGRPRYVVFSPSGDRLAYFAPRGVTNTLYTISF